MQHDNTKDKKKIWNLCYGFLMLEEESLDSVKKIHCNGKSDSSRTLNKIYPEIWIWNYEKLMKKIKCHKKRTKD